MKMSYIVGGVASSAVILASAFIYGTAPKAEAAVPEKEIVYVERVVEKIVTVPAPEPADPEAIFADISDKDRECLALNVYFESRGESQIGQEFVAWVTQTPFVEQSGRASSSLGPMMVKEIHQETKKRGQSHKQLLTK
jgi:hypothetical protein